MADEEPQAVVDVPAEVTEAVDAVEAAQAGEEETANEAIDAVEGEETGDEPAAVDADEVKNDDETPDEAQAETTEQQEEQAAPETAEPDEMAEQSENKAETEGAEGDQKVEEGAELDEVQQGEETAAGEQTEQAEPGDQEEQGDQEQAEGEGESKVDDEANEQTGADMETPAEDAEQEATEQQEATDIPQSDTFADGEKAESPVPHVGEVLSRDGSPKPVEMQDGTFTPPRAETPREEQTEEIFDVHDLEEEIMSPEQDREGLVEMYHQAIGEREQLQQQNHQLQHKLAEYFKKKKSDEQKPEAVDKNEADQEQRYLKYMSQLEELRAEDQQKREEFSAEIEELKERCQEKQDEVEAHRQKFVEFKRQVALNAINSRSGKQIPPKDIEQYLMTEDRKDQEVIKVRLENIKLKNKLKKKEQQLKSKEELADGLHLIDFEQLKIENQTYNEKIEERNEELLKLRKKITNTVQVLTHLKEKLQFVQGENTLLKNQLKDVEGSVAQKRDVLTRTKQARDALRIDNHRLRQNCGLLGNEPLLRDFEDRKDEADDLRDRLERLKMQHAELTLNTASVRRKIEQFKNTEQ